MSFSLIKSHKLQHAYNYEYYHEVYSYFSRLLSWILSENEESFWGAFQRSIRIEKYYRILNYSFLFL